MSERVSLENLGGGAAVEMFDHQLKRVLENVQDPNTPWKTPRRVTLTVIIQPDEGREGATVQVAAESKLVAPASYKTQFMLGRGKNSGHAQEYPQRQFEWTFPENVKDFPELKEQEA